jgi:hypothetical protein
MKYWELIADKLSKAGWSWGCVSAIDSDGRTIWIVDAHRDNGKRFVVRSDEMLTAFLELKAAVRKRRVENEEYIDKLQEIRLLFNVLDLLKNRVDIFFRHEAD